MFGKVLEYAGPYRRTTYRAIAMMVIGVVLSIVPYWSVYRLIEPLLRGEAPSGRTILLQLVLIAGCAVGYAFFYVYGLSLSHEAAYHTLENLRISLQGKLEQLPLGAIQEQGVGVIKKMFIDDIEAVELPLAHALPEGIANLAVPLLVYLAMFLADWKLALLSLGSLPIGLLAMGVMYRSGMEKMDVYYRAAQRMNNTIIEYINGMEVVKVFNRDGELSERFARDVCGYRDFTLAWYRVCWPWMALYGSVLPCVSLFTLPVGAYFVWRGWSTLPDLALVLCMSFGIGVPLLRTLSFGGLLPQVAYKIENLEKLMSASPLQQTKESFAGNGREIRFENVHFSYGGEEVLHGVSFTVPEGSMTALVGESGSGKSTLAKLLVHYYDVTDGAVRIGGQDLRRMSLEALNEQISYVAQEQFLFHMSLLENIRIGRPDASDEEVMEAARRAQCGEFLERLERGIYTDAGDGGKQLSGGERQRISLARAILKNAPVVVLDEATAFMDPENEEKMNDAIAEVVRDKTVIVIAHRLRSIVNADQILVMEAGNLVGEGRHEALLRECAAYRRLWEASEYSADWRVSREGESGV
ncbi:MAG: ABC transporter ATP-binding protein [Eubacteriales bacterium]|nr:ABC transporter ATP-binding protein [Eubacteriales bacterium]